MSPNLDPDNYPHIAENIVSHLPRVDLLKIRLVNSTFRAMVDRELNHGNLSLLKHKGVVVLATKEGVLPFCHPESSLHSRPSIRRTGLNIPSDIYPSNRVHQLLHLNTPRRLIWLDHKCEPAGFRLPEADLLIVCITVPCNCVYGSRSFQHASPVVWVLLRVDASIDDNAEVGRSMCQVVASLLTPNVIFSRLWPIHVSRL